MSWLRARTGLQGHGARLELQAANERAARTLPGDRENVAGKGRDSDRQRRCEDRGATAAAREEVVDILAGAVFTLILNSQVPGVRVSGSEQPRECA
jgi:hypothetical protein